MAKAMFTEIWAVRLSEAENARQALTIQIKGVEKQIDSLLDRLVDASSASVIRAYETKIEKLERDLAALMD